VKSDGTCKIDNEYCFCQVFAKNTILKMNCTEENVNSFEQNFAQIKENYDISQILELNVNNKIIKNLSCFPGLAYLLPTLKKLDLSRNQIESLENNSFSVKPLQSILLELYLSENNLKKIQRGYFSGLSNLQILEIVKNQIEEIEINSFGILSKLKKLNLDSNRIKLIQNEFLFGCTELEFLYLYQNNIKNINTIPFNTLDSLKRLFIFSNRITLIKFGNFVHLQNLVELKLDKNEIGSFETSTFVGLKRLNLLDLSSNKIKQLENGVFNGLKNLKKLDLHLNDINLIGTGAFVDLEELEYLNLESNKIVSLKDVQFNSKIIELNMRYNMISNLSEINSASVATLHISQNRLQEINTISLMPNVEYLDLSQNRLIKIEESSFFPLKKLKYLNLSGNKLDFYDSEKNYSYFKSQSLLESLDLSFNEIKHLDSNVTFQQMSSLKALNVSNNKLKYISEYLFGHLKNLIDLNLALNNLSQLDPNCFFGLKSLRNLRLSFNRINSLEFLRTNKESTANLERLDLEQNRIESLEENNFEFNQNLTYLNVNSNPMSDIHVRTFEKLNAMKTLKLSNTSIAYLFMNVESLKELDLSYLNVSLLHAHNLNNIEWINMANVKTNISLGVFLRNSTRFVDFSFNQFTWDDFKMFNFLGSALATLKLRQTNLQQIEQINFESLLNLKYLDLSYNNLDYVSQRTFEMLISLEYLDLSSNRIYEFNVVLNRLRYLNLENNRIFSLKNVLLDYFLIETFKVSNNSLQMYPHFETNEITSARSDTFVEIYLNQNRINTIKYFSYMFGKLKYANLDANNISSIESDAFLNCRSLEFLSIASNRLTKLIENNFHFLFSLIHLNISFNQISFIENSSFANLNKLKVLDLNYNMLISIENNLFTGLENLYDLYLMSQNEMTLNNQSFHHLPNISTIYLNESLIAKNKCLFMYELVRDVKRNIANKYIFYKSINLVSFNRSYNDDGLKSKCDLVFNFIQFKLHFNLKTDYENEIFFDTCQEVLIERENNYNHTIRKCWNTFEFKNKEDIEIGKELRTFLKVFSNYYYLLSMGLIFSLLCPVSCLLLRYEVFSCLFSNKKASNTQLQKDIILKELECEIKKANEKLEKMILNSNRQKAFDERKIKNKVEGIMALEMKMQVLQSNGCN